MTTTTPQATTAAGARQTPTTPERKAAPKRKSAPKRTATTANRREWQTHYVRLLIAADLIATWLATIVAFTIRFQGAQYARPYLLLSALIPVAWLGVLALSHAYDPRLLFVGIDEYQRVLRAGIQFTVGIALISYVLDARLARGYLIIVLVLTAVFSLLGRFVLRRRLYRRRRTGADMRRVLVVGHLNLVAEVTRQLHRKYHHGLQVIGACVPAAQARQGTPIPVFGTLDGAANAAVAARADTVVVLACPELDGTMVRRLAWQLERDDIDLIVSASLLDIAGDRILVRPVDGLPMMHIEHPRLAGGWRVVKSVFDVTAAAGLLLLLSPALLGLAALIRLDSPGPVFFRQLRVGRHGEQFMIFKYRTMFVDAEQRLAQMHGHSDGNGVLFKLRDDPRVTRVGRILRRYSVDELPQLLNVLLRDMSLVGPRPPLPAEVALYPQDMRRRLVVKPGMTGLWQVSGRSDLSWEEAIRLDLRYVENWSLTFDLVILLRTAVAVLRGAGAY